MKINVDSIAKLAKLKMDADQMKDFETQFEKILEYFSRLQALDTKGVLPLVTPFETFQNLREDEVQDFKAFADEVLKSSDFKKDRLFVVPPVVGGE
jgi:aspartyl-tRNA(Asn)/glutamyl-tRNA(Gln) amidotransferase subunit C